MSIESSLQRDGVQADEKRALLWLNCIFVVAALSALFGPFQLTKSAEPMSVGLTGSVMIKLTVAGLAVGVSFIELCFNPKLLRNLLTIPGLLIGGILILGVPAALTSSVPASLPALIFNAAYMIFVVVCLDRLGLDRLLIALLTGVCCAMTIAWFLYFFIPSYGVFPELLDDGLIVERLSGIGHPNNVARVSVLGLLLALYLFNVGKIPKSIALPILFLATVTVIFAKSRTVIFGGMFGMAVLMIERLKTRAGVGLAAGLSACGFVGLLTLALLGQEDRIIGKVLQSVSKTGNTEELTSGTGRVEIWGRAIELVSERPLTGHGFGAAVEMMIDHSQSTHNSVLHASMVAGVGGGFLMLMVFVWMAWVFTQTSNSFIRAAITFLMISGLMEDTILETFPGPATMIWLACCFYPVVISSRPNLESYASADNFGRSNLDQATEL